MAKGRDFSQINGPAGALIKSLRVFMITMVSIFLAEAIATLITYQMQISSLGPRLLIESASAIIITFPLLHFFVFKPIRYCIADQQKAEAALKESEDKFRSLVDSTDDSIYMVDSKYRYLFINKHHLSRLGVSEARILGRPFGDFHSDIETNVFMGKIDSVMISGESSQHEYKSQRDGRYFLQTFSPVKGSDGNAFAVTIISKNITKRKQMEEELRSLSLTDELTGLYNRRGFMTLAAQHLKIVNRLKKGIFMLYADLDGLKKINDTFGHKEGDRVIFETAYILRHNYRDSDIVARIGGDEFVVLPVGSAESSVNMIKDRLENKIIMHNEKTGRPYKISLSVGIAYYNPEEPSTVEELLAKADKLMYEQKRLKKPLDNKA